MTIYVRSCWLHKSLPWHCQWPSQLIGSRHASRIPNYYHQLHDIFRSSRFLNDPAITKILWNRNGDRNDRSTLYYFINIIQRVCLEPSDQTNKDTFSVHSLRYCLLPKIMLLVNGCRPWLAPLRNCSSIFLRFAAVPKICVVRAPQRSPYRPFNEHEVCDLA